MKARRTAALLVLLGLAQMAGDLVGLDRLRGLAAATAASPAPKVFSAVRGLEADSSRFFIEWRDRTGRTRSLELTPEVYAQMRGPYARRTAYNAALAYGPVLATRPETRHLFDAVARHALCGKARLLRELGLDPEEIKATVRIRIERVPTSIPDGLPLVFEAPCATSPPVDPRIDDDRAADAGSRP